MDLNDLVVDINYQEKFTEDERFALWNKYQIHWETKFIIPIWLLSNYIIKICYVDVKKPSDEFGHGQRILNASLKKDTLSKGFGKAGKEKRIRTFEHQKIIVVYGWDTYKNELVPRIRYEVEKKQLSIMGGKVYIPRDFYQKIDEWLEDFGYERW